MRPSTLSPRLALSALLCAALGSPAAVQARGPCSLDSVAETSYRTLSWADFKGKGHHVNRGEPLRAHIVSRIELAAGEPRIEPDGDGRWTATIEAPLACARMDKFLSGAAHGVRNESVLSHEQRHFDLTEVHARRLGRHVRSLRGEGASVGEAAADLDRQVSKAHRQASAALDEQQRRYDGETAHGARRKAQKRWARDIDRWLAETSGG